jgi:pimeloyl-ACP methyl ester carboxylesterase
MERLKKIFARTLTGLAVIYVLVIGLLFFMQESLIFHPKKLPENFKFQYDSKFEEINIPAKDKVILNGLLFKADSAKGLIFYLHGNAGALDTWGDISKTYTDLNYDLFILDYRGFGKSEGEIKNEEQFYSDVQCAYDQLKLKYAEDKIVIVGYSIGTGPASMLAEKNNPKKLILKAPYFSLVDMTHKNYPFAPGFMVRYKFETYKFIQKLKMPVIIFHGNQDKVIYYGSSLKLKEYFKDSDTLVTLAGQGHNGFEENKEYLKVLKVKLAD